MRQVKPKCLQLIDSRFAYLLAFHTAKNRMQRNCRAKGNEVHNVSYAILSELCRAGFFESGPIGA